MTMKSWERQKGESQRAYEAFAIYRDMGPSRSLAKVAKKLGKAISLIERWSRKWNWVERAALYDDELDRQYRAEQEEERKKMAERHAKQAMMIQNKIVQRLQTLDPNQLSPSDLIRWFDIAVKVERLARGQSTEITKLEHNGQVSVNNDYITQRILSDPESRELARELFRRAITKDLGGGSQK